MDHHMRLPLDGRRECNACKCLCCFLCHFLLSYLVVFGNLASVKLFKFFLFTVFHLIPVSSFRLSYFSC
jgi:hypothetical protein